MTIQNDKNETTKAPAKQPPALIAWHVAERNGKHYWTRIGAAWDHEDAKGMTVMLDLMPIGEGRIVLREAQADTEETGEGA